MLIFIIFFLYNFFFSRKAESVTFPDHLHKTLPNLVQFILRYGTGALKLETGLSICSKSCIQSNMGSTAATIFQLRSNVQKWTQQVKRTEERLDFYRTLSASESDNTKLSVYGVRVEWLQWYQSVLQKRICVTRLQEKNARLLHRVLFTTRGSHIERHKLTTILNRYQIFRQSLGNILHGAESEEELEYLLIGDRSDDEDDEDNRLLDQSVDHAGSLDMSSAPLDSMRKDEL